MSGGDLAGGDLAGGDLTGEHLTGGDLFARLLDDAAVFPPGNAPLDRAVAAHVARRSRPSGRYVGPFVAPASRWAELAPALRAASPDVAPLDVVLVAGDDASALAAALQAAAGTAELCVCAVEVVDQRLLDALPDALPDGAVGVVELRFGEDLAPRLDALRGAGHCAKLRTGGLDATAFPDEQALADALVACVACDVAVKLTAGLHHAVRHTDPSTGFEHHGLLNVLLGVHTALDGGDVERVAQVLADRDGARLARAAADLPAQRRARIRGSLRSVGTCSVDEPLADLVGLGLLGEGDVA